MIVLGSIAYAVFFYLETVAMLLLATFVRLTWPDRALAVPQLWARVTLWGARVLCGVTWRVEGAVHLPDGPALIASRHESAFDTFVWLMLAPRCAYVVKSELMRVPVLGRVMRSAGMISVERADGAAALRRLAREVAAALAARRQVVIFPEGTRVPHGAPVVLQSGIALLAARSDAPVVPVTTDSGRIWPRRAFIKRPGEIRIVVRPALPAGLSRAALLTALTRDLQLDHVDKSVEDYVTDL